MSGAAGVDAVGPVSVIENHDEAYYRWRDAGVRNRVLVHIDAHHDCGPLGRERLITIANYVRAAADDGLVGEIFWVAPDPSWASPRTRQPIFRHLTNRLRDGTKLTACPLVSLPCFDAPVLLDIDIDYFVIPLVRYNAPDRHAPLPWCWPEDLVKGLRARGVRSDLATIACSIEGGYTPLRWKFLAGDLAARWRDPSGQDPVIHAAAELREGILCATRGELDAAESAFRRASHACPDWAAPPYHLAHCLLDAGRLDEARSCLRRARALDPSYHTPYDHAGLRLLQQNALSDAESDFRQALVLDPDDGFALAGLGWLAARRRDWQGAKTLLRQSLAINPKQLDAQRLLADVCLARGEAREAADAYSRSISLALSGVRSLAAPIKTISGVELGDPGHGNAYDGLARISEAEGDLSNAIASRLISLRAGVDTTAGRARLALLYLRQHKLRESFAEALRAMARLPADASRCASGCWERLWAAAHGRPRLTPPFSLS
jgi:Flp pilus assembly protein TadD